MAKVYSGDDVAYQTWRTIRVCSNGIRDCNRIFLSLNPKENMEPKESHFTGAQLAHISSVQSLSRVRFCDPMNPSTPGLPVHHQLPESTQTHVHWVIDAIQPSHPLSSPSPPTLNLSQHQGLFKWVSSSHQVAKVLEFQLQHQSLQWIPRTDL